MKLVKSTTWTSVVALAVVACVVAAFGWTQGPRSSDQTQTDQRQASKDAARAAEPKSDVPSRSDGRAVPQVSPSEIASDPRVWRAERATFLQDKGFAASIQQALSNPNAARLFYALQAVDRCNNLRALGGLDGSGVSELSAREPEFAILVGTCKEVLLLNGSQSEFFAKLRAARLAPADQSILDAVEGKRSAQGSTIAQRFAVVAPTDDPILLTEIGVAWLRSRDVSYAGAPLSDDSKAIFQDAWALAACEATSSCETSIGSIRLCSSHRKCDGSLRSRLQSVLPKEDYETLIGYTNAVAGALRSKDFSAFN